MNTSQLAKTYEHNREAALQRQAASLVKEQEAPTSTFQAYVNAWKDGRIGINEIPPQYRPQMKGA